MLRPVISQAIQHVEHLTRGEVSTTDHQLPTMRNPDRKTNPNPNLRDQRGPYIFNPLAKPETGAPFPFAPATILDAGADFLRHQSLPSGLCRIGSPHAA